MKWLQNTKLNKKIKNFVTMTIFSIKKINTLKNFRMAKIFNYMEL